MVFAGLAASAAVDLLSLLQPAKAKSGGTGVTKSAFTLPDAQDAAATSTQSSGSLAICRSGDTPTAETAKKGGMDTLLSAQGQAQAHHKKRAMGVLLNLMGSSQDGSVTKSDFVSKLGGEDAKAADMFDRIDQNHDSSVNAAELSAFLDTYRRNAEASSAAGKGRSLAVAA